MKIDWEGVVIILAVLVGYLLAGCGSESGTITRAGGSALGAFTATHCDWIRIDPKITHHEAATMAQIDAAIAQLATVRGALPVPTESWESACLTRHFLHVSVNGKDLYVVDAVTP